MDGTGYETELWSLIFPCISFFPNDACHPTMSSVCLLAMENFSQRINLIWEVRNDETKEKQLKETK